MTEDEANRTPEEPEAAAPEGAARQLGTGPVPGADAPHLRTDGSERPRFLLEFPNDPELQRLVRAFEAGNYREVRAGATKLAASTEDLAVRGAARELRGRIEPDPLMKYLLWVAIGLFVFVVWHTYQGQAH
jgi:hypothetical protein